MKKKILSFMLMGVLVLSSIVGCGQSTENKTADSNTNSIEQKKITLGSTRDSQMGAILIVAEEEGYFKEAGLEDVSIEFFQSGGDLTAAVAGGSIPIGSVGDTPASVLFASDSRFNIIAQQGDISDTQGLVVNPDVISKPEDMNGKRIGYNAGSTSEALLNKVIEKYKLDKNSMEITAMGPSEMITAFEKKELDACFLWEPNIMACVKGGGKRFMTASKSYVEDEVKDEKLLGAHGLLIADSDYVSKNPNTTKAILKALNEGAEFINNNKDKAVSEVAKKLSLEEADAKEMMSRVEYKLNLDDELVSDITATGEFLKSCGKINNIPDYSSIVNTSALEEVDSSLVSIKK